MSSDDPRGSAFVRDQQRAWTWKGFVCWGQTFPCGARLVVQVSDHFRDGWGEKRMRYFGSKRGDGARAVSAVNAIVQGVTALRARCAACDLHFAEPEAFGLCSACDNEFGSID